MISENGSVLICIDEYNEGEMSGRIYSMSESEPEHFTSAIKLVKQVGRIIDEGNGTQSTMKVRKFFKNKQEEETKNLANFTVRDKMREVKHQYVEAHDRPEDFE